MCYFLTLFIDDGYNDQQGWCDHLNKPLKELKSLSLNAKIRVKTANCKVYTTQNLPEQESHGSERRTQHQTVLSIYERLTLS